MKKRKLWFLLTAILIVLVLVVCGCGKKKEDVQPATTEPKQETKQETKEETKAETKGETETEPVVIPDDTPSDGLSDAQCVQITMTLLDKLQAVTKVGAGAVQIDRDIVYTSPDGYGYNLVTDPKIQSFYDIYQMLYDSFTAGCIEDRWKYLLEPAPGTAPYFIFVQNESVPTGIYILQAGTGYMTYTPTGDIYIEHEDDRHFYATVPFDSFGETLHLDLDIVLEDTWKINGFHVE